MRFFDRGGMFSPIRFKTKYNKNRVIIFLLCLILILLTLFTIRIKPVISKVAESKAYNIGLMAINQSVTERIGAYCQDYSKLVILEKDNEGNITALRSNITEINKLKSILSTDISTRINQIQTTDVKIPLGAFWGSDLFSGMGPYIPIRLMPVSSVYVDFQNAFSSAGINQTMHEISLKIDANIGVIMPAMKTYVKVSTIIPITNTILLGRVPTTFTNIVGTTGAVQDNALNLVGK